MKKKVMTYILIILIFSLFGYEVNKREVASKQKYEIKHTDMETKKMSEEESIQEEKRIQIEVRKKRIKDKQTKMIITLTGDTSLATFYGKKTYFDDIYRKNGPEYFLKNLENYFKEADINITNLENVFTSSTKYQPNKIYTYKAYSNDYLNILTYNNIRYVNIVNNHMQDYLQSGFDESLKILEEKGIKYFGTNLVNSGLAELGDIKVHRVEVFQKENIKLGMAGYYAFNSSYPSDETIKQDIDNLKAQGCNFIIVSMHGGGQEDHIILEKQVIMSRKFIDFGADMVYGHHPHALQKIEEYKGKKIYYSLGNFLFINYKGSKNPEALLVHLTLNMDERGEITPIYKNVPILWMGDLYSNKYTPVEVTDINIIKKINGLLGI